MHYRKMSNQILADETRRAREAQTRILLANLEGWGKTMSKYDKMIEINREKSDERIAAAKLAIRKMLENGDRISVPRLIKK